jgi:signal transduction histidine kinase
MGWTVSAISALVFASGIVAAFAGVFAFRKRPDPMAMPMTVLMVTLVVWAISDAISMLNTTPEWGLFWGKVSQPGSTIAPVAYFVVALKYAGYERWCTRRTYALLGVVPALSALLALGYPATTLYWTGHEIQTVVGTAVLLTDGGPMYWVLLSYAYLVTFVGLFLFASVAIRAGTIHKKQSLLMFAAGFVPLGINIAFNAGLSPVAEIDFTTTTLTVTGVTFAAVLFRYESLDLSPAAYRNVSALFGDGVLVFDDETRLVEANDHARGILDTDIELRMFADEVFDVSLDSLDRTVFQPSDNSNRFYNLRYSPLQNYQDTVVGHVVVMREITELKAHEQRLSVTNRILRHNLRNELNIILGHVEILENRGSDNDDLDKIRAALDRLMDAAEKARDIQSSLQDEEESSPVDVVPIAESVVDRYRETAPHVDITLVSPATVTALATGDTALETVLKNVIENAIEHNDRENPQVEVTVEQDDGEVLVHVADDGPGLPPEEQRVLERGRETQLEHGSGLGLWLVYWLVTGMGGEISFERNDPRGTIVTIHLETAAEPERTTGQSISVGK